MQILSWHNALAMVQVCNCCISWNAFYYVPEPGLFLGVQKPDMQQHYFVNWLWCCDLLVYRLSSADFDAPPIPNSAWRTLLGGSLDDLFQMPSSSVEMQCPTLHGMDKHMIQVFPFQMMSSVMFYMTSIKLAFTSTLFLSRILQTALTWILICAWSLSNPAFSLTLVPKYQQSWDLQTVDCWHL